MTQHDRPVPEGKDPVLWETAKKRASFRGHLVSYIIVNAFLWAVWYFTGGTDYNRGQIPWPLWSTLGWGIGVAFHFAGAYIFPGSDLVEKEYMKLKNKQQ